MDKWKGNLNILIGFKINHKVQNVILKVNFLKLTLEITFPKKTNIQICFETFFLIHSVVKNSLNIHLVSQVIFIQLPTWGVFLRKENSFFCVTQHRLINCLNSLRNQCVVFFVILFSSQFCDSQRSLKRISPFIEVFHFK